MNTLKNVLIAFLLLLINNKVNAQKNEVTSEQYSSIKIDNVLLEDISNSLGDITLMQNLFGNTLTIETGYNEAVDYWIKFSTHSLCIEFYQGEKVNSTTKYELANIQIENNFSNLTIKGKTVTIGDNANVFTNSQIRTSGGKKMLLFEKQNYDSYIYIHINPASNTITKLGYNGNLL